MSDDNKRWVKEFKKCPGCGSEERYFEGILKELKDRGLLDKGVECFDFQLQQGIGLPQEKMAILPFGSEVPTFKRILDSCCECGMVYSTFLAKGTAKKSLEVAKQPPAQLNRQQRRQAER